MVKLVAEAFYSAVFCRRVQPAVVSPMVSDHPWSGGRSRNGVFWPNIAMRKQLFIILLLSLSVLFPVAGVQSQTTLPPDEDLAIARRQAAEVLSRSDLETAEDYEDFIDRLEKLVFDYQRYFAEVKEHHARKYEAALAKLIYQINDGDYCTDIESLSDDLSYLIDDLREHENHFRDDVGDMKLYKLAKKLRRDLEVYYGELNDEILHNLLREANREQIEQYLVEERRIRHEYAKKIIVETIKNSPRLLEEINAAIADMKGEYELDSLDQVELAAELEELAKELQELRFLLTEEDGDLIIVAPVPAPEPPPQPPKPIKGPREVIQKLESGESGVTREFVDSIMVASTSLPIIISSETGNLRVTGWEQNKILVTFKTEIAAENLAAAKSFADEIELKLFSNDKGVYLKSRFPSLADPKRRVLASAISVKVPKANMITCENSFGSVIITDIAGGLKLNSSYCKVHIEDVSKYVEAASKMDTLVVSNSSGRINLKNSLAPIIVTDCNASLDVENSYDRVELRDCVGDITVRNTGPVVIRDHVGEVTVVNSNGVVQVSDLRGNLKAENSYQSIFATEIEGSVNLTNMSGSIDLRYVTGTATVSSKYGSISGRFLAGPIQIDNEMGEVEMEIYEKLAGPSYINATTSSINLVVHDESNVLLKASTQGGVIQGSKEKVIYSKDNVRSTTVPFGRATIPLDVKGVNSTIIIASATKEGI